jgi:hypothetical protein
MEGTNMTAMVDQLGKLRFARERFEEREKEGDKIILPLKREFNLLDDTIIKSFVKSVLCMAPDYFWVAPRIRYEDSSLSEEAKEGGLVLHTRKTVWLIQDILESSGIIGIEKDYVVGAMLIHDAFYYGLDIQQWESGMREDPLHPYYLGKILERGEENKGAPIDGLAILPEEQRDMILRLIRIHKGPQDSIAPELQPQTPLEFLVFYANRLCSLQWIKVKVSSS